MANPLIALSEDTHQRELISRDEAVARGLPRYFTGKPCVNGHLAERVTNGRNCYACLLMRSKAWKIANPEATKTKKAEWIAANSERVKRAKRNEYLRNRDAYLKRSKAHRDLHPERKAASDRSWRQANQDRCNQNKADYRARHPERVAEWNRRYKDKDPVGFAASARMKASKRRAIRERATPAWADHDKIASFYAEAVRLTRETGVLHEVDHIVPLVHSRVCGLHVHTNLQILTSTANKRKSNKF